MSRSREEAPALCVKFAYGQALAQYLWTVHDEIESAHIYIEVYERISPHARVSYSSLK